MNESLIEGCYQEFLSLQGGEEELDKTVRVLKYEVGKLTDLASKLKSCEGTLEPAYLAYFESELMDVIAQCFICSKKIKSDFLVLLQEGMQKVNFTIKERREYGEIKEY